MLSLVLGVSLLLAPWRLLGARVNPLSYEVNALRGLLIGTPTDLWLDFGVLWLAVVLGIFGATTVLPRLVR